MIHKSLLPLKTRIALGSVFSIFLIALDQLTKYSAKSYLAGGRSYSFLGELISLSYIENPYGFLGILFNTPETIRNFLLTAVVALLLVCTIYYVLFNKKLTITKLLFTCLIISGGLSNLLDRLIQDVGVIDFMSFNLLFFKTGLCNIADLYIFIGGFGLGFVLTKDL